MDQKRQAKPNSGKRKRIRFWRTVRPACELILSVLIVFLVARSAVQYVVSNYFQPVDSGDATPIEVTIPTSASASSIARILYGACGPEEKGLISNTAVFKVYVDFVGKANTMKAGTYILSKNMSVKQMVDIICEGNPPKATVKFTIPEGYTIRDIAAALLNKGLITSEAAFTEACTTGEAFTSFSYINEAAANKSARDYVLEGYLFPDTYEVYADASVETVLIKMLNRFHEVYIDEYAARAAQMNMTTDQVIVLASLIEREAAADEDFSKVSAVFHNRLGTEMPLQSCASLSYVLGVNKFTFNSEELATDSPYNTYKYSGLPVGPVCNPGRAAIVAALYPNEEYLGEDGYFYFCNGNPSESNALVFAKTYEEHEKNVEKYSEFWN